jgi:hypothetical protein
MPTDELVENYRTLIHKDDLIVLDNVGRGVKTVKVQNKL